MIFSFGETMTIMHSKVLIVNDGLGITLDYSRLWPSLPPLN